MTDHSLLQTLEILPGLLPLVLLHPVNRSIKHTVKNQKTLSGVSKAAHTGALRELLQLAALLLVHPLELLVLHLQSLLLQHDLLVLAVHKCQRCAQSIKLSQVCAEQVCEVVFFFYYSCSSVMAFSLRSSSSLRLLICF